MAAKSSATRGPKEIPFPVSLLLLPILLTAAVFAVPYQAVASIFVRRKERRFISEMQAVNRVMPWDDSARALVESRGTLIEEWFGPNGPVRWWWTEDDIRTKSAHVWTDEGAAALFDQSYDSFSEWCHSRYTHPENGTALLIASSYLRETPDPREHLGAESPIPVVAVKSEAALTWTRRHDRRYASKAH